MVKSTITSPLGKSEKSQVAMFFLVTNSKESVRFLLTFFSFSMTIHLTLIIFSFLSTVFSTHNTSLSLCIM